MCIPICSGNGFRTDSKTGSSSSQGSSQKRRVSTSHWCQSPPMELSVTLHLVSMPRALLTQALQWCFMERCRLCGSLCNFPYCNQLGRHRQCPLKHGSLIMYACPNAARIVWLGNDSDPHTWIPDIQGARRDAILDTEALAIHIVQPAPPEMPPFIAGHIILVQQPMTGFKSIVASVCDSASLGMLQPQHATMCPQVLLYSTLIGLVNRDRDCQRPHVDCAAWLADEALVVN